MVASIHATPAGPDRSAGQTATQPADWDISHVTFHDVLSAMNPLQYLPVVGTIYREVTGESVHPAFQIGVSTVGALLFGGPVGLAASMLGTVIMEVARGDTFPTDPAQQMAAAARGYGHLARSV